MSHILKYSEWETPTGWFCNDIEDLAGISGLWWIPARLLNMTPADYIQWLINNYKPDKIKFTKNNVLIYSWNKEHYQKMHSFVLYINRIARQKHFLV